MPGMSGLELQGPKLMTIMLMAHPQNSNHLHHGAHGDTKNAYAGIKSRRGGSSWQAV